MNNHLYHLITHGLELEPHELATITFLQYSLGQDIELIPPSHTPGARMADFLMNGIAWETKSPQGKELRTVEHAFKNASKQSENIIIDLRRTKMSTASSVKLLETRFRLSRRAKRMFIITREQKLLDYRKKSC